jgi:hypothetical protein
MILFFKRLYLPAFNACPSAESALQGRAALGRRRIAVSFFQLIGVSAFNSIIFCPQNAISACNDFMFRNNTSQEYVLRFARKNWVEAADKEIVVPPEMKA